MALFNVTAAGLISDFSAALGILNSSAAVDVVGVFNSQTLAQVFESARPTRCQVREGSKTMEHPIETGAMIGDHRIINQVEIYLPLIIPSRFYSSAYTEIKNLYNGATLLSVQTKTAVYQNMFIVDLPHEETPELYDAITMILHLKEVFFVGNTDIYSPEDPQDTDTVNGGQKQPQLTEGIVVGNTGNSTTLQQGAFTSGTINNSRNDATIAGTPSPTAQGIMWGGF